MSDGIVIQIEVSDDIVPAFREEELPAVLAMVGFNESTVRDGKHYTHTFSILPVDLTPTQSELSEDWRPDGLSTDD